MAGSTPNLGLWYPDGTDPISAGDDGLKQNAQLLDGGTGTVLHFATSAERDLGVPSPTDGMVCTTDEGKVLERYNAVTSWTRLTPTALWMGMAGPSDSAGDINIVWPPGIFQTEPFVIVNHIDTMMPATTSVRTHSITGCTIRIYYWDTSGNWVGPSAGFLVHFFAFSLT